MGYPCDFGRFCSRVFFLSNVRGTRCRSSRDACFGGVFWMYCCVNLRMSHGAALRPDRYLHWSRWCRCCKMPRSYERESGFAVWHNVVVLPELSRKALCPTHKRKNAIKLCHGVDVLLVFCCFSVLALSFSFRVSVCLVPEVLNNHLLLHCLRSDWNLRRMREETLRLWEIYCKIPDL